MRCLLALFILTWILLLGADAHAQPPVFEGSSFRTLYSSAIVVTPVNTAFLVAPQADLVPFVSWSGEFILRRSDRVGFTFQGGYFPYGNHTESHVGFGLRRFIHPSGTPAGPFWEVHTMGGMSEKANATPGAEPMWGLGVKLGSLRTTRFGGDFAFEYGADAAFVLSGGQTQFRATLFFGFGFLLGKEVLVR